MGKRDSRSGNPGSRGPQRTPWDAVFGTPPVRVCIGCAEPAARPSIDDVRLFLGRSRCQVETVEFPSRGAVAGFLNSTNIDAPASASTTRQIAVAALSRVLPSDHAHGAIGLAISQRQEGTGHVVVHTPDATSQCCYRIDRSGGEATSDAFCELIVACLRCHLDGVSDLPRHDLARCGLSDIAWSRESAAPTWRQLISRDRFVVGEFDERPVIFSGSFNPPHRGHRQMCQLAQARLPGHVHWEISVKNADKPPLDYLSIGERIRAVESLGPVLLTNAPRFSDKAELFPGATFLIGADTAMRLDDLRFYGGDSAARRMALRRIGEMSCRFLVFGRVVGEAFRDAADLSLSGQLRELCEFVPASQFRVDVSSRELRSTG